MRGGVCVCVCAENTKQVEMQEIIGCISDHIRRTAPPEEAFALQAELQQITNKAHPHPHHNTTPTPQHNTHTRCSFFFVSCVVSQNLIFSLSFVLFACLWNGAKKVETMHSAEQIDEIEQMLCRLAL